MGNQFSVEELEMKCTNCGGGDFTLIKAEGIVEELKCRTCGQIMLTKPFFDSKELFAFANQNDVFVSLHFQEPIGRKELIKLRLAVSEFKTKSLDELAFLVGQNSVDVGRVHRDEVARINDALTHASLTVELRVVPCS
jgi:hypothetical protein